MSKPHVTARPTADTYAGPHERIVEFTGQNGLGGLISIRNMDDGTVVVDVYRTDPGVTVIGGTLAGVKSGTATLGPQES